ncbi:MAG: hypothetical protein ACXABO_12240 [Promethearchaeota archaeon]|jgi:hypothetical protein
MKILPIANNIVGKLVYFYNPIFRINKILDESKELTDKLESVTNLKLSSPIIEDVNPTKVLGKVHSTLRYDFGIFNEKKYDILDKISIGFGENGYYYDIRLKFDDRDDNFDKNKILLLLDEIRIITNKIERDLPEYYLMEPRNEKRMEISNFSMKIEYKKPIEALINLQVLNELKIMTDSSEEIIPDNRNRSSMNFKVSFFPGIAEDGPIETSRDIIVPDRAIIFNRDLIKPKKFLYNTRIRGIPVKYCLNFIEKLDEILI